MTDKSELKLADGSRWEGDTVVEADEEEALCNFSEHDNAFLLWVSRIVAVFAADALAAIRAVDGDPEYLELKRLRAENEALRLRLIALQPVDPGVVD